MNRRDALRALAAGLLGPGLAQAQPAGGVARIGFLSGASAEGAAFVLEIVVDALRQLGYRQGENWRLLARYADWKLERLPQLARELVAERVDVIATQTTPAALAAKRATSTIPIVNVTSGDAVGSGLVASLARPGGNVTGLSFLGTELAVKQMELLKRVVPAATRIGFLANRGVLPEMNFLHAMQQAGVAHGLSVQLIHAGSALDYPAAFAEIARQRVSGIVVAASISNHAGWREVVERAARDAVPAVHPFREFAEAGGLLAYGFNRRVFYGRAALYIDKILQGAKPGDLPLEQPTIFELIVNVAAARKLGLALPADLLLRAEKVIG